MMQDRENSEFRAPGKLIIMGEYAVLEGIVSASRFA